MECWLSKGAGGGRLGGPGGAEGTKSAPGISASFLCVLLALEIYSFFLFCCFFFVFSVFVRCSVAVAVLFSQFPAATFVVANI